jgi:hypothetical protein
MIRRTLLALALLAVPAIMVAQQPSPMQGQAPAADTSKATAKPVKKGKKMGGKKHKPAAKPSATDKTKP